MTTPTKKTVAVGVTGVIIAVLPALFTYLENRQEIKAKYAQTQTAASSGYDALASSVKELQKVTLEQHDYIVKMQAQFELMEKFVLTMSRRPVTIGTGSGSGAGAGIRPPVAELPPVPVAPPKPSYDTVPHDFSAAQMKR